MNDIFLLNETPFVVVDCKENYTEKLITSYLSLQLRKLFPWNRNFPECRQFSTLKEHLAPLRKTHKHEMFYIVLDNVQRLVDVEAKKKTLEKLFIIANMVAPFVNLVVVHDAHLDAFRKLAGNNLLSDYLFVPFLLEPMRSSSVILVLKYKMRKNPLAQGHHLDTFLKNLE